MSMDRQPTLENDQIRIQPLKAEDFESLYEVAKDPLIWEQHNKWDRYQRPVFTIFFQEAMESGGGLMILDQLNGQVIGSSRYQLVPTSDQAIEIGWTFLSRSHWGGAFNSALKQLMIDHAFNYIDEVLFYVANENFRSQRAVEKLGAVRMKDPTYNPLQKDLTQGITFRLRKQDWN
jgi:RimJ/RimL family protein N-acetyltransferase